MTEFKITDEERAALIKAAKERSSNPIHEFAIFYERNRHQTVELTDEEREAAFKSLRYKRSKRRGK